MFSAGTCCHVLPPFVVLIMTKLPSMGSLKATPVSASQNAMESKKTPGVVLLYCSSQLLPPSEVL